MRSPKGPICYPPSQQGTPLVDRHSLNVSDRALGAASGEAAADQATAVRRFPSKGARVQDRRATPGFIQKTRPGHRGQTLAEVLVAIGILSVIVVFVTADLSNVARLDHATDRSVEVSAANFLLGVLKSDANFWQKDWNSGPSDACLAPLGPFTDTGPSPSPNWHPMPQAPPNCPAYPFTEAGAPQSYPSGGTMAPAIGNTIQYMWNVSEHGTDPWAADLTVWVRRDEGAPIFAYHAIRYQYPNAYEPSPIGTVTPTPSPTPTRSPQPTPSPKPSRPPTPTPSPTPIGV
jgi:pilin/secretion family protein with methylation motif